jgi:hypothetical protein
MGLGKTSMTRSILALDVHARRTATTATTPLRPTLVVPLIGWPKPRALRRRKS